jgi:predicted nucleic acid-binding protein
VRLVLVDTTVFVDFFRGRDQALRTALSGLLDDGGVAVVQPVIAELLYGVRRPSDHSAILDIAHGAAVLGEDMEAWIAAGEFGARWRARGHTLSIVDCLLAAVSVRERVPLWTLDRDFEPVFVAGEVAAFRPPSPGR